MKQVINRLIRVDGVLVRIDDSGAEEDGDDNQITELLPCTRIMSSGDASAYRNDGPGAGVQAAA